MPPGVVGRLSLPDAALPGLPDDGLPGFPDKALPGRDAFPDAALPGRDAEPELGLEGVAEVLLPPPPSRGVTGKPLSAVRGRLPVSHDCSASDSSWIGGRGGLLIMDWPFR